MRSILAMILAGGRGSHLNVLSKRRVKPAVPFAGKYRIIDFVLSNCVNSGIFKIGIPTQYQPHSLNNHIRTGEPWNLDRSFSGGLTLLPPYQRDGGSLEWYRGTADAVYQNLDFVAQHQPELTLVLSGDHVYKIDYGLLTQYHRKHQADLTICTIQVPLESATQFGSVGAEKDGRVVSLQDQSPGPSGTLPSMGIYVFQTDVLMQRLTQDARLLNSSHDLGKDVIPRMLELGDRIYVYSFEDYWMDVGTIGAYWQANMDLLGPHPRLSLSDPQWRIYTRSDARHPSHICPNAAVSNSLISEGCIIEGRVEGSVLSPGVRVKAGAVVRDSIVFSDCEIGSEATIRRAILDKNVVVGQGASIGFEPGPGVGYCQSQGINHGLTLVGRNTRLPAGICVTRNCVIEDDLSESDFTFITDPHVDLQIGKALKPNEHRSKTPLLIPVQRS